MVASEPPVRYALRRPMVTATSWALRAATSLCGNSMLVYLLESLEPRLAKTRQESTLPQPLVASPYASRNEITVSQNPRIGTPIFSASTTSSLIETSPTSSGRTMTGSVW